MHIKNQRKCLKMLMVVIMGNENTGNFGVLVYSSPGKDLMGSCAFPLK